jgi:uncharacterized membrane protein YfcA
VYGVFSDIVETLIYFALGVVATTLGSLSGLGGGFISVPTLYYLGVPMRISIATSKFMVFVNSLVSTYRYSKRLSIPLDLYVSVVSTMIATAYLGAYLVAVLPVNTLKLIIGVLLLAAGVNMVISGYKERRLKLGKMARCALGAVSGAISGFVAGITGLGGGVVNVPVFIYILAASPHLAVSLSMACIAPSSLSSVVRHVLDNIVDWRLGIPLSAGALVGGYIGPRIALRTRRERLVKVVGAVLLVAISRFIIEAMLGVE